MRHKLLAALLIGVLTVTAGVVVAQRGRGGPGQGQGRGMGGPCGLGLGLGLGPGVVSELNLSSAQTAQLQEITDKFNTDTEPLRTRLQARFGELAGLWTAENPDRAAIKKKIAEIDQIRGQIRNAMVERTFAVMDVLTAEQKTKLRTLVRTCPGFGAGMGYGLGMGCGVDGGGCYTMGGQGYRGGRGN
jgi:Spy/CpxP family protein refolding chaperone